MADTTFSPSDLIAQPGQNVTVRNASELGPNDPRWAIFAKVLGQNVDALKGANVISDYQKGLNEQLSGIRERMMNRPVDNPRDWMNQANPKVVPMAYPYGGQRHFDPTISFPGPILS